MSQEAAVSIVLSPPVVPLHKLKEAPPEPVPPPIIPGMVTAAAEAVMAPPTGPKTEDAKGKKKERRMELVGLEPGDPRSVYHLLKLGLKNVVTVVPNLVKKYWWLILTVLAIWYALEAFNVFYLSEKVPILNPLWNLIDKFILLLVFLTASYNNFVAKGIYAAIIIRVGLPLAGRIRREGLLKVFNDFQKIGPGFKESWATAGGIALSLLVGFLGVAAFLSNYLTRNNRIDKIAVSLALAMALAKALSDGTKSLPFMAGRVVTKDLFVLLLRPSPVKNHHIYIAVSGLALGFLCSLPFAYLSKMISDDIGYITGVIAMVAALILFFAKNKL